MTPFRSLALLTFCILLLEWSTVWSSPNQLHWLLLCYQTMINFLALNPYGHPAPAPDAYFHWITEGLTPLFAFLFVGWEPVTQVALLVIVAKCAWLYTTLQTIREEGLRMGAHMRQRYSLHEELLQKVEEKEAARRS
jgi:hypothetical protein